MALPGWTTSACVLFAAMSAATVTAAQAPADRAMVMLQGPAGSVVAMSLSPQQAPNGPSVASVFAVESPACRFPEVFEVPIQLNETRFLLKRTARVSQQREPDGRCLEGIAMLFNPPEYLTLAAANSVVMHIQGTPIGFTPEATANVRTLVPVVGQVRMPDDRELGEAIPRLVELVVAGRSREARPVAESIASLSARMTPVDAMAFFGTLGAIRRANNDLAAAVSAYETALMLAAAVKDRTEGVGVLYDNLATVRQLQKEWSAATAASDAALQIFEVAPGPTSARFGYGLNNRSLLLTAQGDIAGALSYSDRAVAILREALKNDPRALEPFLRDNQALRQRMGR